MRSIYVTGTDTGIGKTVASVALLGALHGAGRSVAGMKPVASGCVRDGDGWGNEDALALQRVSPIEFDYADINPFALPIATAPQLAARDAGIAVTLPPILAAHARLAQRADAIVVEGVGGWMAPLADALEQADVVRALQMPVVLVVGLRLGCLSHARLTARAVQADGCRLLGWIANHVEADTHRADDYLALLRAAIVAPCLGVLPHAPGASPDALAAHLDIAPIV